MKYGFTIILFSGLFFISAACSKLDAPTEPTDPKMDYSLNARTGFADIDRILAALQTGEPEELHKLIHYTAAPCTAADGLGGPPKCRIGEVEGTIFNVLPLMGSEGGFIRQEEIMDWMGVDANGLYAIYHVSKDGRVEEYYPRGEYAVVLKTVNGSVFSLRIAEGGIVRVDSLFGVTQESLDALVQQDASDVILAPNVY